MKIAFANPFANVKATISRKIMTGSAALLALAFIGVLDYLTGREISFGVFYFLPIWLVTWEFNRRAGVLFSFVCAVVWLVVDNAGGASYSNPLIPYWNAISRFVYFLMFAFLLSNVRDQLNRSKEEIRRLRSLLPICSSCKKIRTDDGGWQEIESYIRHHSNTDFSHGICPECAKKLYPEIADDLLKKWRQTGK